MPQATVVAHITRVIRGLDGPLFRASECPQLSVTGTEDYIDGFGDPYTRYGLAVSNWSAFPDELFAVASDLPPCGLNPNASRTWVDIYAGTGNRIYGFCALSAAAGLQFLWFGIRRGVAPPECVYVTLYDRRCNLTYKSNCAPTAGAGQLLVRAAWEKGDAVPST